MIRWLGILLRTLRSAVRTRRELALENLALRQQLAVWKARQPRPRLTEMDRIFWVVLSRLWKNWRSSLQVVRPEDRGAVAPPGLQAVLGMEESTPMGSARDWEGPAGSDTADEPRQSPLGCTKNPRRAVEARPNGLAGDGFEVHGPASEAAVAGVADIFEEPRPGSDRVRFLHGAHRDLSSPVRARDADPQQAPTGASQCRGASDCGMEGAPTARGVRAGGGAPVSHSGQRPSLWRAIFASGQDVGHPGDGCPTSWPDAKIALHRLGLC